MPYAYCEAIYKSSTFFLAHGVFSKKGEAGFDAWIEAKTIDIYNLTQIFPPITIY